VIRHPRAHGPAFTGSYLPAVISITESRTVYLYHTGDGLTLSVFTGGQPWEGVNPSASSPWGSLVVPRDADLPSALAVAEAAYQAIKRTMRGPKPITGHPSRRRDGHGW
jgi:hypothetical protein